MNKNVRSYKENMCYRSCITDVMNKNVRSYKENMCYLMIFLRRNLFFSMATKFYLFSVSLLKLLLNIILIFLPVGQQNL